MVDLGSGGVFAGKENSLNLLGKCKPEDEFGRCVVTSSEVGAHGAPVWALLPLAVGL